MAAEPVSALQAFYQRHGKASADIAYTFATFCADLPAPQQRFLCSVSTPQLSDAVAQVLLDAATFTGEGTSKKAAKKEAAAAALAWLQQQPAWAAAQAARHVPADTALGACLTNQVCLRTPGATAVSAESSRPPSMSAAAAACAGSAEGC